jgi:hypothetical protein
MQSMHRIAILKLWDSTEKTERWEILSDIIETHGEVYSQNVLIAYLRKKYCSHGAPSVMTSTPRHSIGQVAHRGHQGVTAQRPALDSRSSTRASQE